ncbi:MAG TPA: RNA polymerase sigma factor [Acidimicrobiia bacterium]|jgi:RNA polymerase sigma-70 factor, ECF subfamily|nr:RNA polymerase sigma factor [Acidimicrobiia bacterium]
MDPAEVRQVPDAESPDDERALVADAQHDPTAFGQLYRRYVDRIYAFAYRRTWTPEAAEDVTAATFERALRHLPRFDPDGAGFGPWLFRIAANELVDHYRREGRTRSDRGQRGLHVLAADIVEDDLDAVERDDEVRAMVDRLGTLRPRYQTALSLRYLAGLSADEAAAAMGCSKAVLAVTLHRALGALRRAVEAGTDGDAP